MFSLIYILTVLTCGVNSARILGVVPTPIPSHQIFFNPIWKGLADRGHELILFTTLPTQTSHPNIKQILCETVSELWAEQHTTQISEKYGTNYYKFLKAMRRKSEASIKKILDHPDVQKVLNGKLGGIDLVITEMYHPLVAGIAHKLKCPFIGVTTTDVALDFHKLFGNAIHPLVHPSFIVPYRGQMTFIERCLNVYFTFMMWMYEFSDDVKNLDVTLKEYFGQRTPPVMKLMANASLVLLNVNPVLDQRPLGPAFITIGGGLQIQDERPLSPDVKHFLDGAANGAIYFSLGTHVKSKHVEGKLIEMLVETFRNVQVRVLWKYDGQINNLPDNIKVIQWASQQDILRHPNVKLFITQGGLHSIEEAIYFGVPILGIPFLLDQEQNIRKVINRGAGLLLHKDTLTQQLLQTTIIEAINNPKYKVEMLRISALTKDQPLPPLEKALWWIEFVIRHKGANHLRNPVIDMPFYQYFLIDVIFVLLCVVVIFVIFTIKIIHFVKLFFTRLVRFIRRSKKKIQ